MKTEYENESGGGGGNRGTNFSVAKENGRA
jgi:hypothetical protein